MVLTLFLGHLKYEDVRNSYFLIMWAMLTLVTYAHVIDSSTEAFTKKSNGKMIKIRSK